MTKNDVGLQDMGDPNSEYGPNEWDLELAFTAKDGRVVVVYSDSFHETINENVAQISNGKLKELKTLKFCNTAGG